MMSEHSAWHPADEPETADVLGGTKIAIASQAAIPAASFLTSTSPDRRASPRRSTCMTASSRRFTW